MPAAALCTAGHSGGQRKGETGGWRARFWTRQGPPREGDGIRGGPARQAGCTLAARVLGRGASRGSVPRRANPSAAGPSRRRGGRRSYLAGTAPLGVAIGLAEGGLGGCHHVQQLGRLGHVVVHLEVGVRLWWVGGAWGWGGVGVEARQGVGRVQNQTLRSALGAACARAMKRPRAGVGQQSKQPGQRAAAGSSRGWRLAAHLHDQVIILLQLSLEQLVCRWVNE